MTAVEGAEVVGVRGAVVSGGDKADVGAKMKNGGVQSGKGDSEGAAVDGERAEGEGAEVDHEGAGEGSEVNGGGSEVNGEGSDGEGSEVDGIDEPDFGFVDMELYFNKNVSLLEYSRSKALSPQVSQYIPHWTSIIRHFTTTLNRGHSSVLIITNYYLSLPIKS